MVPFRRGRARRAFLFTIIGASALAVCAMADQPKKHGRKRAARPGATATATPEAGAQVPLPIGREAKGLVFPDIDENGHLRGRFVAGTARRVDQDHMQVPALKTTTIIDDDHTDIRTAKAR